MDPSSIEVEDQPNIALFLMVSTAFYCFAKNEQKQFSAPKLDESPKINQKIC